MKNNIHVAATLLFFLLVNPLLAVGAEVEIVMEADIDHSNQVSGTGGMIYGFTEAKAGGNTGLNPEASMSTEFNNDTFRNHEPGDGGDTPWSFLNVTNQFSVREALGLKTSYEGLQVQKNSATYSAGNTTSQAKTEVNLDWRYTGKGDSYAGNSINSLASAWGGEEFFKDGHVASAGAEAKIEGFTWSSPDASGSTKTKTKMDVSAKAVASHQNSTMSAQGRVISTGNYKSGVGDNSFKSNTVKVESNAKVFGGGDYYYNSANVKVYSNYKNPGQ